MQKILLHLEKVREERNISKKAYCSSLDITPQYYHLILTGKSKPNAEILFKMAEILGFCLFLGVKTE